MFGHKNGQINHWDRIRNPETHLRESGCVYGHIIDNKGLSN